MEYDAAAGVMLYDDVRLRGPYCFNGRGRERGPRALYCIILEWPVYYTNAPGVAGVEATTYRNGDMHGSGWSGVDERTVDELQQTLENLIHNEALNNPEADIEPYVAEVAADFAAVIRRVEGE